ncbi:hypothetical protein BS78_05G211600 [Paspalum vaginatum]|nr:hypothetical protein BS78_05G211600 [Paspalum vaginatum]
MCASRESSTAATWAPPAAEAMPPPPVVRGASATWAPTTTTVGCHVTPSVELVTDSNSVGVHMTPVKALGSCCKAVDSGSLRRACQSRDLSSNAGTAEEPSMTASPGTTAGDRGLSRAVLSCPGGGCRRVLPRRWAGSSECAS